MIDVRSLSVGFASLSFGLMGLDPSYPADNKKSLLFKINDV